MDITSYLLGKKSGGGGGKTDLNEYFNIKPESIPTIRYWVRDNYVKKGPELYIPDNITNISMLCDASPVVPKVICGNQVTDIHSLYQNSTAKEIDFSGLDTTNVIRFESLCDNCSKLKKADISMFDTRKLGSYSSYRSYLFRSCYMLEECSLPDFRELSLYSCFSACFSLKKLILNQTDKVCGFSNTFQSCYHMDGTVNAQYNPEGLRDGRIYVPDNLVDAFKTASGWSDYADIIRPISELD